jgi:Raf kinase inhibitor-like YbhB/YbcL family protein
MSRHAANPDRMRPHNARQGINDYTDWFAGDNDMRGDYYGYDGPCPPWNDEIVHRYVFTLFALDVAELLDIEGKLTGQQVRAAMQGHILAEASLTGTYTLNPLKMKSVLATASRKRSANWTPFFKPPTEIP